MWKSSTRGSFCFISIYMWIDISSYFAELVYLFKRRTCTIKTVDEFKLTYYFFLIKPCEWMVLAFIFMSCAFSLQAQLWLPHPLSIIACKHRYTTFIHHPLSVYFVDILFSDVQSIYTPLYSPIFLLYGAFFQCHFSMYCNLKV